MSEPGPGNLNEAPPQRILLTLRIFWVAILLGELAFLLIIQLYWRSRGFYQSPFSLKWPFVYGITAVIVAAGIGYLIRMQFYKRHWRGDRVMPAGYLSGNLILLMLCSFAGMYCMGVTMFAMKWFPYILPAGFAIVVHLINYPNGKPMGIGSSPRSSVSGRG